MDLTKIKNITQGDFHNTDTSVGSRNSFSDVLGFTESGYAGLKSAGESADSTNGVSTLNIADEDENGKKINYINEDIRYQLNDIKMTAL